jgi:predicted kinase
VPPPTLIIISGPSGTGKTTLAHEIARRVPCIAICRDEIKEGMVHTVGSFEPRWGDELTQRTFPVFFEVLGMLLRAGVTVVAEAAFQHHVWAPQLEPLLEIAACRVVRCRADTDVATKRVAGRVRTAHADRAFLDDLASGRAFYQEFRHIELDIPTIDVDTTSGYSPPLDEIVAFATDRERPI